MHRIKRAGDKISKMLSILFHKNLKESDVSEGCNNAVMLQVCMKEKEFKNIGSKNSASKNIAPIRL